MTHDRRDANEREILDLWEAYNCIWIPMDRFRGFDGLLIDLNHERAFVVEIKNGRTRWQLTQAEAKLRENIGALYHIVTCLDDAERLIEVE